MIAKAGERFTDIVQLTPDAVSNFARTVGDHNPIHHDADYAQTTRFKHLIASGTQTSALLMAATATYFSKQAAMLGLEFSFRFRRAVYADEMVKVEWLIVRVEEARRLNGRLIDLRGRLKKANGETAVGAKGRVLVADTL